MSMRHNRNWQIAVVNFKGTGFGCLWRLSTKEISIPVMKHVSERRVVCEKGSSSLCKKNTRLLWCMCKEYRGEVDQTTTYLYQKGKWQQLRLFTSGTWFRPPKNFIVCDSTQVFLVAEKEITTGRSVLILLFHFPYYSPSGVWRHLP